MHSDEYCVSYNFLEAEDSFREDGLEPITLAVHGTAEMLSLIEKKPANWDGPISFGLFVDFHSKEALEYISDVHRCDEEFRKKVTVHFAFRLSAFQDICPSITIASKNRECMEFLKNRDKYRAGIKGPFQLYPSNLMRNIARHGAKSDIHFIADGDMVMNTSDEISAWEIPYSSSLWEVQVILHRNDLYNADYFPARIKVMQSLVYSLCRANYTFNLLSHVFNVHEGIKLDDTNYSKSVIAHSKKYGRKIAYDRYVKEMDEHYPSTLTRCGKFVM
uniref:Nucleotid_trans domain-containing protein n=1 Tax=Caenorhabditis tropicalis TaxID=1561998 RepID=A0A1I7TN89_9PELO